MGHLSDAHGTYALGVNDRDDLVYHREIMQGDVQVLADEEVQTALPPVIAHVLGTDVAVSDAYGVQGLAHLRLDGLYAYFSPVILGLGDSVKFLFVIFLDADDEVNLVGYHLDFRRACNLYVSVLVGIAVARVLCLK